MIRSRDNARVKRWASLARDSRRRRAERRAIAEGLHLVAELRLAGLEPRALLVSESGLEREDVRSLLGSAEPVLLSDAVFRSIVQADNPPGIAAEIELPAAPTDLAAPAVFLESVQDPGNVGAILRSAAAFGVASAVLDRACADPWSPKVLRAGMGAHFVLSIHETAALDEQIERFGGRVLCAVPREGVALGKADLSGPIGWLFGAEGAGVSLRLQAKAAQRVSIPTAERAESLNVAAAAAICLHQHFSRRAGRS